MKLISYNIAIFFDNSKKVAKFIKQENPDIVAFQEIIRSLDKSVFKKYRSQEKIKEIIGKNYPYRFFGPQWVADVSKKNGEIYRDYGGLIEQGNEVLSKFPLVGATNEFYHKTYEYSADRTNFYTEDHARSLLIAELDVNGKKIQILNVHGTHSRDKKDSERALRQTKFLLKTAKRKKIPTIILGDFNLLPETKCIKMIDKEYRNLVKEFNIKSTRPDFKDKRDEGNNVVDYIFVSDDIEVKNFRAVETNISDHYPLVLEFELK